MWDRKTNQGVGHPPVQRVIGEGLVARIVLVVRNRHRVAVVLGSVFASLVDERLADLAVIGVEAADLQALVQIRAEVNHQRPPLVLGSVDDAAACPHPSPKPGPLKKASSGLWLPLIISTRAKFSVVIGYRFFQRSKPASPLGGVLFCQEFETLLFQAGHLG